MKFPPQDLLIAKDNSYTKKFKDQFCKLCVKYNNVADVDAIAAAKKKVESVKLIMEKNIELTLQNCVKIESMEKATGWVPIPFLSCTLMRSWCVDELMKKAEIFKISAVSVKSRMWWKNIKVCCHTDSNSDTFWWTIDESYYWVCGPHPSCFGCGNIELLLHKISGSYRLSSASPFCRGIPKPMTTRGNRKPLNNICDP